MRNERTLRTVALVALLSSGSLFAQSRAVGKGTTHTSTSGFGVGLSIPTFVGVDLGRSPAEDGAQLVLSIAGNEEGTAPFVARVLPATDTTLAERVSLATPIAAASSWSRVRDSRTAFGAATGRVVYEVGYF